MATADAITAAASIPQELPPAPAWSPFHRAVFRFGFAYWCVFCFPIVLGALVPVDAVDDGFTAGWTALCAFVARHILGITRELQIAETGSGDRTIDWVSLLFTFAIALATLAVWSILDRRRLQYERLREHARVALRYSLSFVMLGYGVLKLHGGQFPAPGASRLLERYGDSTPMGILWAFMGTSHAYVVFSGAGETLGAVLLLFRRTATLGALVLFGVLTNVVLLNFCYDVPVKINSTHYLVICVLIALPDLGRLAEVLVFHRPVAAREWRRSFSRPWMRIAHPLVKYTLIVFVLFFTIKEARKYTAMATDNKTTWLDDWWTVKTFARDGRAVPALADDQTRWKRVKFESYQGKELMRWHNMDDSYGPLFSFVADDKSQLMTLTTDEDPKVTLSFPLKLVRVDPDHFHIEGKIAADDLAVDLERLDLGKMPLVSRGFHWINEVPFNR